MTVKLPMVSPDAYMVSLPLSFEKSSALKGSLQESSVHAEGKSGSELSVTTPSTGGYAIR